MSAKALSPINGAQVARLNVYYWRKSEKDWHHISKMFCVLRGKRKTEKPFIKKWSKDLNYT
ncbi:hypothetical protein T11_1737 [Trichinella zimbabwensis]|uniref:Uncharacterized protein n=1 Tax=Trichinella zimbabwensis TaxID=268475 RepID=A0A0V1HSN9_9BILA|nr:hypothetical protein T11_1737 [Trichinella zimbabwensis]